MQSVLSDIGADGGKTGMLGDAGTVLAVAEQVRRYDIKHLVVDPVMVATSGDSLLSATARATFFEPLLPLAHVVTPNLHEAGVLCGFPVEDLESMKDAAMYWSRGAIQWGLDLGAGRGPANHCAK